MLAPALEDVGLIMLKEQGWNKYNHLPPYALCNVAVTITMWEGDVWPVIYEEEISQALNLRLTFKSRKRCKLKPRRCIPILHAEGEAPQSLSCCQ